MTPHVGAIIIQAVDGRANAPQLLRKLAEHNVQIQPVYLYNFSKVLDNLAIALDHFFLDVEPDLAPRLCRITQFPSIERLQSIPKFEICIGNGQNTGDTTGQGICAT
jgi:hypothetical protein